MRFNNSLALGIKSLRQRVERAILKVSSLIAKSKIFWGISLSIWDILTIEKGKESLLSNNLSIMVPYLMVISKLKTVAWSPWCTSLFGYISQIDLPNSLPAFVVQKSSMKRLFESTCFALISSEEISAQIRVGSIHFGMPIACFTGTFPALKQQFVFAFLEDWFSLCVPDHYIYVYICIKVTV